MPNSKSRKETLNELYKKQSGERFIQASSLSEQSLQKRSAIVQMKLENPSITLQALGDRFNLTRERIRQILISEGFITHRKLKTRDCLYCSATFVVQDRINAGLSLTYCSKECKTDSHRVYLNCKSCGKQYFLGASAYRGRQRYHSLSVNNYCSIKCRGIGVAKLLRNNRDAGEGVSFDWGWGRSKDGISLKKKKAIADECGISLSYLYHMIRGIHHWRVDAYEAYMKAKNSIN